MIKVPQNPTLANCPKCKTSWRGRDILESLASLDVFSGRNIKDLEKYAATYGYSKKSPKPFSRAIVIMIPDIKQTLIQCPTCFTVHTPYLSRSFSDLKKYIEDETRLQTEQLAGGGGGEEHYSS